MILAIPHSTTSMKHNTSKGENTPFTKQCRWKSVNDGGPRHGHDQTNWQLHIQEKNNLYFLSGLEVRF